MKRLSILLAAIVFSFVSAVWAAVPQLINFQGVLKNGSGNPVTDSTYTITFTIYDAPSGGLLLWNETQSVSTNGGNFTILLGASSMLPADIFNFPSRWLGIVLPPEPEITPRQQMVSVPTSFYSGMSDSTNFAWMAASLTCWGCVGEDKIAPNAVGGDKIIDGSVGTSDLANGSVSEAKLVDGSVSTAKIQDGTIQFSDIGTNGAVDGQVMKRSGSTWVAANDEAGNSGGWADDGAAVRLTTGSDAVGIGTASPSKKLEVAGSIKVGANDTVFSSNLSSNSPLSLQAPAGATRMYIDDVTAVPHLRFGQV